MTLIALVANFTINNLNTFPVEVVAPDQTFTTLASQTGGTFFAFGTYTVRQSGTPGVFFQVVYPATRLLSTTTAAGNLHGNFQLGALLQ